LKQTFNLATYLRAEHKQAQARGSKPTTYNKPTYTQATKEELQRVTINHQDNITLLAAYKHKEEPKRYTNSIPKSATNFSLEELRTPLPTKAYYMSKDKVSAIDNVYPRVTVQESNHLIELINITNPTKEQIELREQLELRLLNKANDIADNNRAKSITIDGFKTYYKIQRRLDKEQLLSNEYPHTSFVINSSLITTKQRAWILNYSDFTILDTYYPKKSQEIGHTKDLLGTPWSTALEVTLHYNKQEELTAYSWNAPSYTNAMETSTNLYFKAYQLKHCTELKEELALSRKKAKKVSAKTKAKGATCQARAKRAVPTPPSQAKEIKLYQGKAFKLIKSK